MESKSTDTEAIVHNSGTARCPNEQCSSHCKFLEELATSKLRDQYNAEYQKLSTQSGNNQGI